MLFGVDDAGFVIPGIFEWSIPAIELVSGAVPVIPGIFE